MRFLILTHVHHVRKGNTYFAYGPYVREMNIWGKFFSAVTIIAPLEEDREVNPIEIAYEHDNIQFVPVKEINLTTWEGRFNTIFSLPVTIIKVLREMKNTDHIHLRCPGNMGLLGTYLQCLYPAKKKTAKYAGNWDPQSKQPSTYKLQQRLISDPSFSKNMKVLVYGNWKNQTQNILPFFTFSYSENELQNDQRTSLDSNIPLKLLFVGALVEGKNPRKAAEVALLLKKEKVDFQLDFCGEGALKSDLQLYIDENKLSDQVIINGNLTSEALKSKYKESHFLIFLSESEGWPKVVAEAMYFGCLPITTSVSCVADMLGNGKRGDLVKGKPQEVVDRIKFYIEHPVEFNRKSALAKEWSKEFTKENFELELMKVINNV